LETRIKKRRKKKAPKEFLNPLGALIFRSFWKIHSINPQKFKKKLIG